jgi:hypothetical protein
MVRTFVFLAGQIWLGQSGSEKQGKDENGPHDAYDPEGSVRH